MARIFADVKSTDDVIGMLAAETDARRTQPGLPDREPPVSAVRPR